MASPFKWLLPLPASLPPPPSSYLHFPDSSLDLLLPSGSLLPSLPPAPSPSHPTPASLSFPSSLPSYIALFKSDNPPLFLLPVHREHTSSNGSATSPHLPSARREGRLVRALLRRWTPPPARHSRLSERAEERRGGGRGACASAARWRVLWCHRSLNLSLPYPGLQPLSPSFKPCSKAIPLASPAAPICCVPHPLILSP